MLSLVYVPSKPPFIMLATAFAAAGSPVSVAPYLTGCVRVHTACPSPEEVLHVEST